MKLNKEYMRKLAIIRFHYGFDTEIKKAIEEAEEYVEELKKAADNKELIARGAGECKAGLGLISEMADVYVTIEHIKRLFKISDKQIKDEIEYKINRQIDRIHKEKGLAPCDN